MWKECHENKINRFKSNTVGLEQYFLMNDLDLLMKFWLIEKEDDRKKYEMNRI